jgi:hypothetical protein
MARITLAEAQAWVEATKFTITSITNPPNSDMLTQLEEEVLARVGSTYDTSTWVDANTTPRLIRVAIAKLFVAWAYRRQYSESMGDVDAQYAFQLESNAELIISGVVNGTIELPGLPGQATNSPAFYPTDASSSMEPTFDDPSLGPARFSMGQIF